MSASTLYKKYFSIYQHRIAHGLEVLKQEPPVLLWDSDGKKQNDEGRELAMASVIPSNKLIFVYIYTSKALVK